MIIATVQSSPLGGSFPIGIYESRNSAEIAIRKYKGTLKKRFGLKYTQRLAFDIWTAEIGETADVICRCLTGEEEEAKLRNLKMPDGTLEIFEKQMPILIKAINNL